ncbi:protein of unknown function [Paracoccus aminovorans]|uniref:Uncharacterized protein n=1 Tax=Paracoccus aminovorans TaxID=34004 RepID=A0A1I2Z7E3_9RHOB|nr:DUF4150 domain-containing protein [Paracoccus aminovorans]CQR84032.1 hypothetical protein JCM7685_pAMV3p0087 [Paracoccus aminovorans]SFH33782.1 protein of unknown function [Paracoccus aminovorans]
MAHTVSANGLTISHRGTGGHEVNSTPDVCRLANNVPVPFSIISFSRDLVRGTRTVLADGGNTIDCRGSAHSRCIGDEPGVNKGVISGTQLHESTWITWSPNVRVEGRNIARLSDKMFMNNRNCISGAGGHYEVPAAITDPIMRELCKVFCEARDEWHQCKRSGRTNCPRPSGLAKDKLERQLANKGSTLSRALGNRLGAAERTFYSTADKIFEGARKIYDRSGLERAIKRQVEKLMQRKIVQKGAQMAGRAWLKLVPGLNVLSTIYDVVDTAISVKEVYDMIKSSDLLMDKAIRIQPDFAVMDQDGALQDIYDFKFDDPATGYQDDWQSAQRQQEAYGQALGNDKVPQKVDNQTCQCDKAAGAPPVGMI